MKRLLLVICLLLMGCDDPTPDQVTIVSKWHEPPRTFITYMAIPCGKSFVMIPMVIYDDEDWVFDVRWYDEKRKQERYLLLYTKPECFNVHSEGDQFFWRSECSLDDPNEQRRNR